MGKFKSTPRGIGDIGGFGEGIDGDLMRSGNRAQRRLIAKHDRKLARMEAAEEANKAARRKRKNP